MLTKNYYRVWASWLTCGADTKAISTNGAEIKIKSMAYGIRFGYNNSYEAYLGRYSKSLSGSSAYGVCFGDGGAAPTSDDYTLNGNLITAYSAMQTITNEYDSDGQSITAVYTITNTGSTEFTIREVGLLAYTSGGGSYLVERTVLDSPVTIPAGGIGQVTYTIRLNWPTA